VAAVKLGENYEEIGSALSSIFQEIESLIRYSKINVAGKEYLVKAFLGRDYEV